MKYRARRRVTTFDVVLHADGCARAAEIVDVTDRGARIRLEFGNLEPGSVVSMDIRGQSYGAKVIWNKEGESGLAFDGLLPLDAIAAINRSLRRVPAPRKRRFLPG